MIRILIIGKTSGALAEELASAGADPLAIETARMPAEGIRKFEATPPDVVVFVEDDAGARARQLIGALRARPLGALVPLVMVCPSPDVSDPVDVAAELGVHAHVDPIEGAEVLLDELAQALGVGLDELLLADALAARLEDASEVSDFVLERVGPDHYEPPVEAVELRSRESLFPVRARREVRPGELGVDDIQRKLREVRHEDYFALLEVRRGAEGPTIRQSFQRLMARFDPQALEPDLAHRLSEELAEIRDAFEDAWAVLGDPQLRDAYMVASMRPRP